VFVTPAESAPPESKRRDRDEPDDDFAGRDRDPYADRDLDDRSPRRKRKRKSGSSAWVWILLLGGGAFIVLCCGGFGALFYMVEQPTLHSYTDPGNRFKAEFPETPTTRTDTTDAGLTRTWTESVREFPEETWFVNYVDLKAKPTGAGVDKALRSACDEFAKVKVGTSELARIPATQNGLTGMELHLEHADATQTVVRFLLDGQRLYAVGITSVGIDPESLRMIAFWESFQVLPSKGDAKAK